MQCVADFSDRFRFRGIVAITRAPNQPIAGANSEHDFREVRRKGDYAIDRSRKTDSPPGIVCNLASCTLIRRSSRRAASKQDEAHNNRKPYK